jgi:glycosyltransferase involved in cell wall biosynthesis
MRRSVNIKNLVFWQPNISVHNIDLFRSLASKFDQVVICVVERLSQRRAEMGMEEVELPNVKVHILSNDLQQNISLFENLNDQNTLHIFSGIRAYKPIWPILKYANKNGYYHAILSETQNWLGVAGFIRKCIARFDAYFLNRNLNFILAISRLGVKWFESSGYSKDKIFEWAYFSESPKDYSRSIEKNEHLKFLFVGRFIKVKGIVWLLESIRKIDAQNFELHLLGDGPMLTKLKDQVAKSIKTKVHFHGAVSKNDVMKHLETADYLVLPSIGKDGWGAVVNEALHAGVPCIVSEYCGASTLITQHKFGYVVKPEEMTSLKIAIEDAIYQGKVGEQRRKEIIEYSKVVSGESGAQYLIEIIGSVFQGDKSVVPSWRKFQTI